MITRMSFRTVAAIFASVILSGRNNVDGSTESCTIELKLFSGFVRERGYNFRQNSIPREENDTIGCPCSLKTCVSLCVEENYNENSSPLPGYIKFIRENDSKEIIPEEEYHLFEYDPCIIGWMASSVEKNFAVFKNGSIRAPDFNGESVSDFGEYCLLRDPKSGEYSAKVCRPWIKKGYYEIASLIIAIIIMLVILIVYSILPELRNLHGLIFQSYIATYIGIYVFAFVVMFTTESRTLGFWFNVAEITARYFCASCAFWLNVMSFNIWRSFRNLRPIDFILRREEKRKFTWYAIYAWCGPIVLFGIAAALTFGHPYLRSDIVYKTFKQWSSVGLVTVILVVNIVLHSSTALAIREQKKETTDLVDGVNRHRDVDTQWFNLYLKLFVIMGGHIVAWVIWLVWSTPVTLHLLATVEVVQSSLTFVFFLWKDIRRSLYRRFVRAGKLEMCFKQQLPVPTEK